MQSEESRHQGSVLAQDEVNVALPVQGNQLGSFLTSLLGQPQSIEREILQEFDINHEWLLNLHEVIHQRICQQASAHLLTFKAVIFFANQMKRTLTTIEAFQTYRELQQQKSIGVQLEWSYLVEFPNTSVPERQRISFHAKTEPYAPRRKDAVAPDPIQHLLFSRFRRSERNRITYRIDYTERTWGNDLENLIGDTVATAGRSELRSRHYEWMQFGLIVALAACCFFVANRVAKHQNSVWVATIERDLAELKQIEPVTLEAIDSKLLRIGQLALTGPSSPKPQGGAYFLAFFSWLVLIVLLLSITEYTPTSFVVLTEPAEAARCRVLRKEKRNVLALLWGYAAAITCSVIAGFVYAFLS